MGKIISQRRAASGQRLSETPRKNNQGPRERALCFHVSSCLTPEPVAVPLSVGRRRRPGSVVFRHRWRCTARRIGCPGLGCSAAGSRAARLGFRSRSSWRRFRRWTGVWRRFRSWSRVRGSFRSCGFGSGGRSRCRCCRTRRRSSRVRRWSRCPRRRSGCAWLRLRRCTWLRCLRCRRGSLS